MKLRDLDRRLLARGKRFLARIVPGTASQMRIANENLERIIEGQRTHLEMMRFVAADVRRLADIAETGARAAAQKGRAKIYVCHCGHEHDRLYAENVSEYLEANGTECKVLELGSCGRRPELQGCLDEHTTAVLGFNSQLDHSWLPWESFMAAAARRRVPVIQWILDHPSARWSEFERTTSVNSRFLLNTRFAEQYFHRYCLVGGSSATIGGVGPSRWSRVDELSAESFAGRPIKCLVPISLKRLGGTAAHVWAAIDSLDEPLAGALREAHASAVGDLTHPLETHLVDALEKRSHAISNEIFNSCFHLLEESVQAYRRLRIFEIVRDYPVLVQSDDTAVAYFSGAVAACTGNVSMRETLTRMQSARAVLSVSPLNDMIHDRTMNGLNAGCANIIEDNLAHRGIFRHGKTALLFRYGDDSLRDCLDIVCNDPQRAYAIAEAGRAMRDDIARRYCSFQSILDLARR